MGRIDVREQSGVCVMSNQDKWEGPLNQLLSAFDDLGEAVLKGENEVKGVIHEVQDRVPVDTGKARDSFYVEQAGDVFSINTTDERGKILALEFGHSQQAPLGFIEISARHAPVITDKIIQSRLRRNKTSE